MVEWCSLFAHAQDRDVVLTYANTWLKGMFDLDVLGVRSSRPNTLFDIIPKN